MSVFVGNLPFDASEEQLMEVMARAGPIKRFKLGRDGSGRPRGFAFCDYYDLETAKSAIRNLQGHDIGGRPIRLDMSDQNGNVIRAPQPAAPTPVAGGPGMAPVDSGYGQRMAPTASSSGGALPGPAGAQPVPKGITLPPGASATDAISRTLAALPPGKLLDIMTDMKGLVKTAPEQARALLNSNPQLAYALFQAMLMMNIVDPAILERMLAGSTPVQQPQTQPQQPGFPAAPAGFPHPPPGLPPFPGGNFPPPPGFNAPPPMPPQQQQPPPQATPAPIPDNQAALIQQVLQLSQAQIDALPQDQRLVIMQIRQQAAASGLVPR